MAIVIPLNIRLRWNRKPLYTMLGGMAGLNTMCENSKAILELAGYVTRWNFEEGTIVTERIRRDAVRLQRTILLIQLEMLVQSASPKLNSLNRAAFRIEEATAASSAATARCTAMVVFPAPPFCEMIPIVFISTTRKGEVPRVLIFSRRQAQF
ncbi:MAG TPA: hypothetical protein VK638_32155 [Edaphobacter sp.]|nr:hypothetical protein [Edaphobacter sp.]